MEEEEPQQSETQPEDDFIPPACDNFDSIPGSDISVSNDELFSDATELLDASLPEIGVVDSEPEPEPELTPESEVR